MVSHVIADDIENHEYQEARELFELPCVMVSGGTFYFKAKSMVS